LIKKARITLVAFDSLGDSLIYLMIAENLRINDYEVTFYSGLIHQMQEWVPQLKVRPYPPVKQFDKEFDQYDFVIMSPPSFIRAKMDESVLHEMRQKWALVCQKAPTSWFFNQRDRLLNQLPGEVLDNLQNLLFCGGSIRSGKQLGLNVVEMALEYMKERMHLSSLSRQVLISPPTGLQHRRYRKRIVISPDSAGPEKKNWSPRRFLRLCHKLTEMGYEPNIVVAPKNYQTWKNMKGNVFSTPLFPNIGQLAAFIYESGALVANDSGNGHLASFLNVPVVTIYRKRNANFYWRPSWGPGVVICPKLRLPWFGGAVWKPFVKTSEIISALDKLVK